MRCEKNKISGFIKIINHLLEIFDILTIKEGLCVKMQKEIVNH